MSGRELLAVILLLTGAGLLWFTESGEIVGAILLGLGLGAGVSALMHRD